MYRPSSNTIAAIVFGILITYNIFASQPIAAAQYILYAFIWAFLTYRTVDGKASALPTRDAFFHGLTPLDISQLPPDQRECTICYELCDPAVKLPCGHIFCSACIRRIFSPESHEYRCPYCRQALFRMQAPWDTVVVKLFVCNIVLDIIERLVIAGYTLYYLTELQLSWWSIWNVVVLFWGVYNAAQDLKRVWENLDHNGLMVWEMFEKRWVWAFVPFQVSRLVAFPRSIRKRVMDMICAMR